jgi:hypothetical protein
VIEVYVLCVCRSFAKTTETDQKKKQYEIKQGKIHTREKRKCWMGVIPRPSADYFVVGRRQKDIIKKKKYIFSLFEFHLWRRPLA